MSTQKPTSALLPFALALGLGLAALPLSAQSHPNRTQGFDPRGTYSVGDLDSINLFNGALTVTIPIGPRYPVGSSDYGFALVYNSNAWTVREVCEPAGSTSGFSFSSSLQLSCIAHDSDGDGNANFTVCDVGAFSGGWAPPSDSYDPRPPSDCHDLSRPNPTTNAGLGWQLNLGKLLPAMAANDDRSRFVLERAGWNYASGDGALHPFGSESGGVFYSQDGSYLRMKACNPASPTCWEIDFPDGSTELHELAGAGERAEWRLTKRSDAFGNGFTIAYTDPVNPTDPSSWLIKDSHDREHLVSLEQPDLEFPRRIVSILFGSEGPRPQLVRLHHERRVIARAAPHNDLDLGAGGSPATLPAQFLTQIDVESAGTVLSRWVFGSSDEGYEVAKPLTARINGVLKRLKTPTGATFEWTYGAGYKYPSGASGRGHLRSTVGVLTRSVTDVTGAAIGTWTYTPKLEERPIDNDCQYGNNIPWLPKCHEKEFTNTVHEPGGYRTKHYFSVYPLPPFFQDEETDPSEEWDGVDYGLPFTRKLGTPASLGGETLFLSTETFAPDTADSSPIRRGYVRYERNAPRALPPGTPEDVVLIWDGFHTALLNGERVAARAEIFRDDPAASGYHWRLTQYGDWDGVAHYREETLRSNFPEEQSRSRKVKTDYTGVMPAPDQPWFLGKFSEVVTEDFGSGAILSKQVRQVCFDASKPFVKRTRTLAGNSAGPNDVLAVFTRNDLGQVTEERLYGGDGAGLGTESLCNVSLTGETPTSKVQHTYSQGVRSRSVVLDPCSNTPIVTLLDQVLDTRGQPTRVQDATGIGVALTYDFLGRRLEEIPDATHGARTTYEYFVPGIDQAGNLPAEVLVKRLSSGGAQLAVSEVYFDGLGRVIGDVTWMPTTSGGAGQAVSQTKWTAQGWKDLVLTPRCGGQLQTCGAGALSADPGLSALQPIPENPDGVTRFELYDNFGRPGRIVAPDGFLSTATYTGVREVSRTVRVAAGAGGALTSATRTERYDFLGRLIDVTEPSGPNGANVKTIYSYDVGDRLVSVSTTSAGVTQARSFDYDGRGFLRSESHPEIGEVGNGTKVYSSYDARGLAGHSAVMLDATLEAGDTALDFRYDAAGRLIEVIAGSQPIEQYFYAWTNDPSNEQNLTAGKIVEARRYNPSSRVTVSESYEYKGVGGRVSKKTTRTSLGHRFEIAATYNQLGDMASTTYPTCSGLAGCETVDDPRTVTYGYQLGFLNAVGESGNATAWLTGADYAPSGRWHQLTRANGTADVQVGDPNGLGRPQSISVSKNGSTLWTTGPYGYDGAGNITAMGPEVFTYDKVSRLRSGTVKTDPTSTTSAPKSEALTYDAFGNQLSRSVNGGGNSAPPVNAATNRLTQGVYESNGNVGSLGGVTYVFDALNSLTFRTEPGGQTTHYLYAPGGERVATLRPGGITTWTLRGLGNEVLRVFEQDAADTWRRQRDYIYRGGQLLASTAPEPEGVNHYHLDHLGSTRLVTGPAGEYRAFHAYLPFGEEVTPPAQSATALKYTGHEREEGMDPVSRADDLDYMHARWCSPTAGRFLSVDPVLGRAGSPQSWNRYGYVRGNPLILVDPDGEDIEWFARDDAEGGMTNFGHTSLRVVGEGYDFTYDFGRYGKSWGFLKSSGEGILRVWTNFSAFLAGQASSGNARIVHYETSPEFDFTVMAFFGSKFAGRKVAEFNKYFASYVLDDEFSLRSNNCTTICRSALQAASGATPSQGGIEDDLESLFADAYDPREVFRRIIEADPADYRTVTTPFEFKKK